MRPAGSWRGRAWFGLSLILSGLAVPTALLPDPGGPSDDPDPVVLEAILTQREFVPSGTVVGDGPPDGWSHLVIKSHPRIAEQDRSKVNRLMARMVGFVFTVNLADVGREDRDDGAEFFLKRLAVGQGTRVGGRDVVMRPDNAAEYGADLGPFGVGRLVMQGVHDHQKRVRLVVAARHSALLDCLVYVVRPSGHRRCVIRYYHRVDPDSGRLDVLAWLIDLDDAGKAYLGASGPVEWLPPSMLDRPVMRVDPTEITLAVPGPKAFACESIPRGERRFLIPPAVVAEAGQARFEPEEYRRLSAALDARMDSMPPASRPE